jgi:hypothetical protein
MCGQRVAIKGIIGSAIMTLRGAQIAVPEWR